MGEDGVVGCCVWQAGVGEGGIRGQELQVAVGDGVDGVEGLVVQTEGEGESDRVGTVVAVRAWYQSGSGYNCSSC